MTGKIFDIPVESFTIRRHSKLWFKYYWYKWILRKDIIGFYDGIPIFLDKNLEEEE